MAVLSPVGDLKCSVPNEYFGAKLKYIDTQIKGIFFSTRILFRRVCLDFELILDPSAYAAGGSTRTRALVPVPGKPISANPGLNIANRVIIFFSRLDSVPESTINPNLGINCVSNLTHLARSINSLIGVIAKMADFSL